MNWSKRKERFTIAFYNVENLFDTENNPLTSDDDFTPSSKRHWNKKKYLNKIKKITSVISQIGTEESILPPVIIGVAEVENTKVIADLVNHKHLSQYNYGYVHYDSPDERGIDVALLYNKLFFDVISSKTYPLYLTSTTGEIDYTRDLLVVKGKLNGELIHVFVNHWPSRRDDSDMETKEKRIKAAKQVLEVVEVIKQEEKEAKFIIMGDFNDDPISESISDFLVTDEFYNPMKTLFKKGVGTLTYHKEWHLFDQIIISKGFLDSRISKQTFLKACILNKKWLRFYKGKFKNSPFRTYIGPWYQGGYSDHFPVYLIFKHDK